MGAWSINETGEFMLNEPYKTQLAEVKSIGTRAWQNAVNNHITESGKWFSKLDDVLGEDMARKVVTLYLSNDNDEFAQETRSAGGKAWREAVYSHLAERTDYSYDELRYKMAERLDHEDLDGYAVVDGFIVSALEGSL